MVKFICAENSSVAVTRFCNRDIFSKRFYFVRLFIFFLIYCAYMEYFCFSPLLTPWHGIIKMH